MVVLSGSAVYEERLRHAARIYHQRRTRMILLTDDGLAGRWSRARQRNLRSIERGRDMLLESGVQGEHIVLLSQRVDGTYDEARAVQAYARARGLRSVLIVTSPYHTRRALWVFRRVLAADAVSVGVDPAAGEQSPGAWLWWLSGRGWLTVGAEYPKLAYYVVKYW